MSMQHQPQPQQGKKLFEQVKVDVEINLCILILGQGE
jgi:hypothetical protein